MTSANRKERDAREMRERILSAAHELFRAGGLKAVSMRKIAERIEYSPASLYHYFPNKDAIVDGLRDRGFEILVARQNELRELPPGKRLHRMCKDYLRFAQAQPGLYELMFTHLPEDCGCRNPDPDSPPQVSFRLFGQAVVETLPRTGVLEDEVLAATISVWAGLHGLAMILINNNLKLLDHAHEQEIVNEALELMLARRTQ